MEYRRDGLCVLAAVVAAVSVSFAFQASSLPGCLLITYNGTAMVSNDWSNLTNTTEAWHISGKNPEQPGSYQVYFN